MEGEKKGFFGGLPKVFRVGLAVIAGLVVLIGAYHAIRWWVNNSVDTAVEKVVKEKNDTLRIVRKERDKLQADNERVSRDLLETVNILEKERNSANLSKQSYQTNLDNALAAADRAIDKKNAVERKAAADAASQRMNGGRLATSVDDVETNTTVAKLQARVDVLRDSTNKLTDALGVKDARIKTLEEDNANLTSDLEKALNFVDRGFSNARSFVQNKQAKASKGLIRKIANGNRIRDLRQVDSTLAAKQEELRVRYPRK